MASSSPTSPLARLRAAGKLVRTLPAAQRQVERLQQDNRRLRQKLKDRALLASGSADAAQERQDRIVEDFHRLYYDELKLHKRTRWRGARVLKTPLDLWIYQELIFEMGPDLIIETGTMYGGSAFYLASILDLADRGEVLTIDKNERAGRPQHPRITYLTGSSTDEGVVAEAARRAEGKGTVMVLLDSSHKAAHVLDELRAYHPLVTPGSYLVVEDTNVNGHPVDPDFGPGPMEALETFLEENGDFEVDRGREKFLLTYNPSGFLRRRTE